MKMDPRERDYEDVNWIQMVQNKGHYWAFLRILLIIWIP
jgi:hypothetical protein